VVHCAALQNVLALQFAFHQENEFASPVPVLQIPSETANDFNSSGCSDHSTTFVAGTASYLLGVLPNHSESSCSLEIDMTSEVEEIESKLTRCITDFHGRVISDLTEHNPGNIKPDSHLNLEPIYDGVKQLEAGLEMRIENLHQIINEDQDIRSK
jgi:hypothetical protein